MTSGGNNQDLSITAEFLAIFLPVAFTTFPPL